MRLDAVRLDTERGADVSAADAIRDADAQIARRSMPMNHPAVAAAWHPSAHPKARVEAEMARTKVSGKASGESATKSDEGPVAKPKPAQRKTTKSTTAPAVMTTLPVAMTGRASPAKAADGDEPVFAYIRSLPQPQRAIAERVDALAASTLPGLQRAVKWGMAWYGVGDGWCFSCGGFAGHVKLTFGRGTSLDPVPPIAPIGMGKTSRGVDIASADALNERQAAAWMLQATALPGFGGKKR